MSKQDATTAARALEAEEAKSARQRMHVKNSYYRSQNRMAAMRQEVRELEGEYARAVQIQHGLDRNESPHQDDRLDGLVRLYSQLCVEKEELRRENPQLTLLEKEHTQFHRKTERFVETGHASSSPQRKDGEPSLGSLEFEPMTAQDCHEVSNTVYLEICAFLKTHSYLTTGTPLFGWHDRREEHSDHIKFTLKKRFPGVTPTELSTRAWRVTSSPQELRALYSPILRLAFKTLQIVDDNNVVMYRSISSADGAKRVQSLFLISRFQVDDSFIISFRSVDRRRLRAASVGRESGELQLANVAEWLEVFSWTFFEHAGDGVQDEACLLSYGGIKHSTEAARARVWMMEVLLLALRWEAKVVGPPFMLT